MASSVKSRRNHYETLGLQPGATDQDIAAAFAVESRKIIQNPRVNEPDVREQARAVRTAHQTLRDPVKRAAYDASIGVGATAPVDAKDAPAEPDIRPFVAAPRGTPTDETVAPGDEHIATPANDAANDPPAGAAARAPRPRPPRREPRRNAGTGLPEGLFVAAMAARSAQAEDAPAPQATGEPAPESQAEPPPAPAYAEAPFAAGQADRGATAQAPESAPDPAVEPSAEPAYRFEDPGAGTAAFYGEGRGRNLNRAAVGGVATLAAVLTLGAFWMWPEQNSGEPPSVTAAGNRTTAAAGAQVPPDVLDGAPSEQAAADPDDPLAATEVADAGSYQSLTFTDSGPIPGSVTPPVLNAPVPSAVPGTPSPGEATASPPAASAPGTATAAAPAATTPSATSAPPVASAPLIAAPGPRPAPPDLRPVTPPKLVRGSILNSDNRRGAFQGTVSVRFTVGADGRATGCSPTASSGNPRLDAYTCELVQQRLQFAPAATAQGQPVASEMRATYTWGRKRRTLTGRLLDIVR